MEAVQIRRATLYINLDSSLHLIPMVWNSILIPLHIPVRFTKHRQTVKLDKYRNVLYIQKTNHYIVWEGTTVQRRAARFWQRRTVEAVEVRRPVPHVFNRILC